MNKWYSHLEEKINQAAYSGKVKKVLLTPSSVNIITAVDARLVYTESDCVALEKFLNDMLEPVTDRTDEIIEMLRDTKKDGKIHGFSMFGDTFRVCKESGVLSNVSFMSDEYDKIVEYLESLYDEEFTIEHHKDIDRVKIDKNPTITLANGEVLKVVNKYNNDLFLRQDSILNEGWLSFVALKGAKVVQSC